MSFDHRVRRYQRFLKSLKRPESTLCSCPLHIHPRNWVPPPCLTSRAQEEENIYGHRRTLSNPELRMELSTSQTKPDTSRSQQESLKQLYKEARILKEAYANLKKGDKINRDSRDVIKKWSVTTPRQRSRSGTESHRQELDANEQIAEIDRSLAEAVQEEAALKQELQHLRETAKTRNAIEEENKKLKNKIRHLQRRIKRQDEAKRVSRESLQAEREMGTREEYILISLKKKYEDLLQYVLKVESENQKLKSLQGMSGDGDEFLHDYDRETSEMERHSIRRLLRKDLDVLRAEMTEKDNYITECEKRLQSMEALKEENLALHKSLRNNSDRQRDPQDVSTALEDEWMMRLAETREMYEKAIEGYRDQLHEMQDKLQKTQANHASHVEELAFTIHELKQQQRSDSRTSAKSEGGGSSQRRRNLSHEDQSARRAKDYGVGERHTRTAVGEENGNSEGNGRNEIRRTDSNHYDNATGEVYPNGRDGASIENQSRKATPHANDKPSEIIEENERRSGSLHEESERRPGSLHEESQRRPVSLREESERRQASFRDRDTVGRRGDPYEVERNDKRTQTSPTSYLDNPGIASKSGESRGRAEIVTSEGDMGELKENLEKVNHLVKRLESMKLSGEGANAILSTIRDTISDCLHEWRETFRQQKASQKDSADENKDYIELQRKLRSKSKQLEAKQKQCKLLEEQNASLAQECRQLESKIAAVQASGRLEVLQDLPQTLRNTEIKLSEFQEAFQRVQEEKSSLQEQIKHLNDKLNRKESKLAAEHEHTLAKSEEVRQLRENIASMKLQFEEDSREVSLLKEQLLTKDTILEHTSAQLEERIRECARLSSQIERQTLQLNEETRNVHAQLNEQETSSHKQLMEAQALASRYQAQLSALHSEKDHSEKLLRQNARKLQEQVDLLQLRNSTLQRQLNTITSTYHSMFSSVEINNPINPPGIGNNNG